MIRRFTAALFGLLTAVLACAPALAQEKPAVIVGGVAQTIPANHYLLLRPPTTANASINFPHGTAPTSPNNGDCWTTTASLYCRINGSTVDMGAAGGSTTFIGLTDVPASFTGASLKWLRVNTGETALEFITPGYFALGTDAANLTGTVASARISGSYTGITGVGTLTIGTWNATAVTVPYGGTGATSLTAHGVLLGEGTSTIAASAAGTSGQPFLSGGASADGAYGALDISTGAVTGDLPFSNIAQLGANTVAGNQSASTADIAALSMPSCSASTSALTWTTSTGFGCNSISPTSSGTTFEGSVVKPVVSAFTWVNQGDATATDGTRGIVFVGPFNAGLNVRLLVKTAPSPTFDVVMRLQMLHNQGTAVGTMLIVRNSSNGRFIGLELDIQNTFTLRALVARWASATSFNATISSANYNAYPQWLRMNVTSTTITFYISPNGLDWANLGTETISTYLTAAGGSLDQIGIGQRVDNANTWSLITSFDTNLPS